MARFELKNVKIMDPDGAERPYAIIADRSTFRVEDTDFGRIKMGSGFVRCRGRQYVADYGRGSPIYAGGDNDVYYAKMFFFDGEWRHGGASERGLHTYVTANSGTGKLFGELEAFSAEAAVPVCG
jgi:hypothetical protein